jgi:hypothetical protein
MTTEDIIIHIFIEVDEQLPYIPKHPQAKLYPSELVTIGILFALKGSSFRAFFRWLKRDYDALFAGLPDRTRLQRLLEVHQDWCAHMLAKPSFFTVIDSYPIELIFPIRQGRSEQQVGKKGKDKGRWSVGIKFCWLINDEGRVVGWDWSGMNPWEPRMTRTSTLLSSVLMVRLLCLPTWVLEMLRVFLPISSSALKEPGMSAWWLKPLCPWSRRSVA